MAKAIDGTQWHASYWNEDKHGSAWARVKDALQRDWAQTKADVHAKGGQALRQGVDDTVKQAAGRERIPAFGQPNTIDYSKVEPAVAYGFGARQEYGQKFTDWDDALETKLANEWDPTKTGMAFEDAKPFVRRGWDFRNK